MIRGSALSVKPAPTVLGLPEGYKWNRRGAQVDLTTAPSAYNGEMAEQGELLAARNRWRRE